MSLSADLYRWQSLKDEKLPDCMIEKLTSVPQSKVFDTAAFKLLTYLDVLRASDALERWTLQLKRNQKLNSTPTFTFHPYRTCVYSWLQHFSSKHLFSPQILSDHSLEKSKLIHILHTVIDFDLKIGTWPLNHTKQEGLDLLLHSSIRELLRNPSVEKNIESSIFLELGANPNAFMSDSKCLLDACLPEPRAWYFIAQLFKKGLRVPPEKLGSIRQSINCILTEDDSQSLKLFNTSQRLEAIDDLLAGGHINKETFRSKSGTKFGDFAFGALWSSGNMSLAKGLALSGVKLGKTEISKIPQRFISSTLPHSERFIEIVDVFTCGQTLGPFHQDWVHLASKLHSTYLHTYSGSYDPHPSVIWGAAFCRWARQSFWSKENLDLLSSAWPELEAAPSWLESVERLELISTIPSNIQTTKKTRFSL